LRHLWVDEVANACYDCGVKKTYLILAGLLALGAFSFCAVSLCAASAAPTVTLSFDEGQGTAALKNGAAWTPGIHGRALALDPAQRQYAEMSRAAVKTDQSFTVST
jgi:hypothetical protein